VITLHTSSETIDSILDSNLTITTADLGCTLGPNTIFVLKNGSQSIVAQVQRDKSIKQVSSKHLEAFGIKPRSAEQIAYMSYLMNDQIPLVVATGIAGSGKSLLAIAVALEKVIHEHGQQDKIILCKSLSEIGPHRLGIMPGGMMDKLEPYIDNYRFCLRKLFGQREGDFMMNKYEEQGTIIYKPINTLRGISIENTIVIIDEAQNLDSSVLRALGTRMGEGARLFLLGDTSQVDEKLKSSGMGRLSESEEIEQSELCSVIHLIRNERSPLSALLDKVLA